jgi:hypothetical protein
MILDQESVVAAGVFVLIKLVGYRLLVRWLERHYHLDQPAPAMLIALSRIALGALVGGLLALAFHVEAKLPWYLLLVVLRAIEWAVVFWFFYERRADHIDWRRLAACSFLGTVASCLLDVPAVFSAIAVPIMAFGFC